jgi:predicted nicotinamide N-methyase
MQHVAGAIGRQVWPAAEALCEYLLAHLDDYRGRDVLELGAGIGTSPPV